MSHNRHMNANESRKSTRALFAGDRFMYRGQAGTFIRYTGPNRFVNGVEYRPALVVDGDGDTVEWMIHQSYRAPMV